MNNSLYEITRLKEENTKLKELLKKYKKRVNNAISKTDVEFMLNNLIPDLDDGIYGSYEVFFEMSCPKLDLLELIKVITLLLKSNRDDLADFYCYHYIVERNLDEVTEINLLIIDEYGKTLNELSKEVVLKRNSMEIRLKIFFDILSYLPFKDFVPILPELLEQNIYKLTNKIFETQNDFWFLKMFNIVSIYNPKLLQEYFDYLFGHWNLINGWILEENLSKWESYVKIFNHKQLERSLAALKEYWNAKKNGLLVNQKTTSLIDMKELLSSSKIIETKEWDKCSELRKHGYEVNKNKTIEERRIALHKAMKHIPLSKILSHIHWLLKNTYKRDGKRGDFSNSINAYEMDLEYLQQHFLKD